MIDKVKGKIKTQLNPDELFLAQSEQGYFECLQIHDQKFLNMHKRWATISKTDWRRKHKETNIAELNTVD